MTQSMIKVYFHFAHTNWRSNPDIGGKIPAIVAGWVDRLPVKVDNCWYECDGSHEFKFYGTDRAIQRLYQRIQEVRAGGWPIEVIAPKVVN